MSDAIVVLRTYADELSAQLDASILDANGIAAQVLADTAAGAYPSMALLFPIRLLVRADDAALAREILDTPADPTPDGEAEPT
jgi:hypothetical protein